MPARVSIILPTFNRAGFLPEALAAIAAQQLTDWEFVIVDDGSIDETRSIVGRFANATSQRVEYVFQQNQGAYGARNTGLGVAQGEYIAFYDSDDLWLPHHLSDCVAALEQHSELDWVFGSCRMVNLASGELVARSTFYVDGEPRPFMRLKAARHGALAIINDPAAACCQIQHGLYCGLQNSVIRRSVFENYRFDAALRNEGEDQVIVIWALVNGFRFGYFDNVHVEYRIHESNSSSASLNLPVEKQQRLHEALIAGFQRLSRDPALGPNERRALQQRLGQEYFWHLGYATFLANGRTPEALAMFRRGIAMWPWDWRFYKTYAVSAVRSLVGSA